MTGPQIVVFDGEKARFLYPTMGPKIQLAWIELYWASRGVTDLRCMTSFVNEAPVPARPSGITGGHPTETIWKFGRHWEQQRSDWVGV
jgi:hypothetical protein